MPVIPPGQNEKIVIGVQATVDGVRESIDQLKSLGSQLAQIDKSIRKGFATDAIQKEFASVARQYQGLTKSVVNGSQTSEKSIEGLRKQVNELDKALEKSTKKRSIGFVGSPSDAKGRREYLKSLEPVGLPIMGSPKSFAMMIGNVRRFRREMEDTSKIGVATTASIKALSGGPPAFMQQLNSSEKFNATLGVVRKNIEGLSRQLIKQAKDQQWIGRQMMEGITLPIVGLGTIATQSFLSVQSEMVQLKKVTEFEADYNKLTESIRETSKEFGLSRKSATAMYKEIAALGIDGEENIKKFSNAVAEIGMVGDIDSNTALQFFRTMNAIFADGETDAKGLDDTRELMAKMSAVADETSLQLQDLAAAFPEVAPVMKQMGFSAEGVAASLAGMYKRGIPATEAAHGLKFALQRLVSPTKDSQELIDKMGFSFFDAAGNIKKADIEIMAMAKNLTEKMNPEEASKAMGELFGLRQTARMQSYFQDVNIGRKELEKFTAGTIDASQMTSDYARALVAAGFGAKDSGTAMDRYNKALEEIKKDPTTGMKRLRAAFDDFKVQLGTTIAPAVIAVGDKLMKMLDAFTNLPSGLQFAVIGFASLAAVLGPIRYIGAQATHAIATLGSTAVKVLPKLVDITGAMAQNMVRDGGRGVLSAGTRYFGVQNIRDRMRMRFGLKTREEKLLPEGPGKVLGAETAETKILEESKENLAVASAKVAAAEELEALTHEKNTAAMGAESAATSKAAAANAQAAGSAKAAGAAQAKSYKDMNPFSRMKDAKKQIDLEKAQAKAIKDRVVAFNSAGKPYDKATGKLLSMKDALESMTDAQKTQMKVASQASPIGKYNVLQQELNKGAQAAKPKTTTAMPSIAAAELRRREAIGAATKRPAKELGLFASLKQVIPGGEKIAKMAGSFKALIPVIAGFSAKLLLVVAVVAAIAAVVYAFTKIFRDNWDAFIAAIKPGIDAIKEAFGKVKEAISGVVKIFSDAIGTLGTSSGEADSAASAVEGIGGAISKFFDLIAGGISMIASVINFIKPVFESLGFYIRNVIGFISSVIKGDWSKALKFMVAGAYEVARPILMIFDVIAKGIAQYMSTVLNFAQSVISKIPGLGGVAKTVKSAQEAIEGFSDRGFIPALDQKLRAGMGGIFGPANTSAAKGKAGEAGKDVGEEMGDGINEGLNDSAGSGESWVKSWIDKVVGQIDKQIDRLRKSAVDALQKAQDAILKSYDDRINAIEETEKAEEKLLRTEEYLSKRRELLQKKEIDRINYKNNREKALYEGRYNDVRMLDLEFQKSSEDANKQLSDLDNSRARDLLKEQRDALKEQINAEKDAAKEKLDIQKRQFEDYLDLITKMTPVTIDQFQSMMDQINSVLEQNGAKWPEYTRTATDLMLEVLRDANDEIRNEFNRSSGNPLLAWVESFAAPDVVRILKEGLDKAGGGGVSGGATPSEGGGVGPEDIGPLGPMGPGGPLGPQNYPQAVAEARESLSNLIDSSVDGLVTVNKKLKSEIKVYTDTTGTEWTMLNDELRDAYGNTANYIKNKNGEITRIQIGNSDDVREVTSNNLKNVADVYRYMNDNGIKPATQESKLFLDRLKEIGVTVADFKGQNVTIKFDLETERLRARIDFLKSRIDPTTGFIGLDDLYAAGNMFPGFASGGYIKAQKEGVVARIAEGGYDEYVITTDPKYRAANMAYLAAAASKMGMKMAAGAAVSSASSSMGTFRRTGSSSSEYGGGSGDIYICVDTFIGEEQWFNELASKYNMKITSRDRKIAGQQKRVISSYNNRWDVK